MGPPSIFTVFIGFAELKLRIQIFELNLPFAALNAVIAIFLPFGAIATLFTVSDDEYHVYIFLPPLE